MPENKFPHDSAYKAFFSNPAMVKSLLLDFVPEEFVKYFDFDTLENCQASHIAPDLQQRHDDIIWRVRWRDAWCYIYIMLEFQSTQDYWMPLRILTYTGLLWEGLIRQEVITRGEKLPPVFPIVIYNGEREWSAPLNIRDLQIPLHGKLTEYQPAQKYFLIDEGRLARKILEKAEGECAHIFRLELAKTREELAASIHEFLLLLKKPGYDTLKQVVNSWITSILRKRKINLPELELDELEDAAMIEYTIERWHKEAIAEGMRLGEEKGIAEGLAQGKAEGVANQKQTLLAMLGRRFSCFPHNWVKIIENISDAAILSELMIALLTAQSLEEFEEILFKTQ